jgi:ubiquinone/menaquinone biosynthesis C-methylase UbiE
VLRRLLASWPDELPSVRKSLECGTFAVRQVSAPAHRLAAIADQSVDVVLSNAALEHVENIDAVCTELARITKPGGINAHQVDFRDHREFSRPLEFLLDELPLSDDEYRSRFGNRRRCSELCDAFAEAGFDIEVEVNALVDEEYFRRFLPRLRNCRTAYNAWPEHDLKVLGARFVLRKR